MGDNTLKVYWLRDGNPLPHGKFFSNNLKILLKKFLAHRFRTFHDFGFVSFDILHVYSEDSGTYTCVAENAIGKAETSTQFNCLRKNLIFFINL